jgi:hypothetical protein
MSLEEMQKTIIDGVISHFEKDNKLSKKQWNTILNSAFKVATKKK